MKNLWLKKFSGHITVEISGKGVERFINRLVRENVQIWNVRRLKNEVVSFQMFVQDVPLLRQAVHYNRVKVRFKKKAGLPFLLKSMKKNSGFLIGALMATIVILLLSNMIWKIDIKGASPEVEFKLTNQLNKLGVKKGQLQFLIDDPETIQKKLTAANDEITWIGVELKGTTYQFQVVEKERPEVPKRTSPRHLVAKKEAVVVDYFVEKGQTMVSINDFVRPGQILVSGALGNDDEQKIISAKGIVLGKTWYKTDSVVELKTEMELLTGKSYTQRLIKFGNFSLPIWGFKKEQYKDKKIEEDEKKIKFLKWTIPISFSKKTVRELEIHEKVYKEEEARKMAMELAKKDLQAYLSDDSKIVGEKVLHEKIENGKLKLSIIYDVIENIVKEEPIHSN